MSSKSPTPFLARIKNAALAFDSWLNASLYDGGRRAGEAWDRYAEASNRLRVRGFKRAALDLTSEATSLGVVGGLVLLVLATPAFQTTGENWLKSPELAVVFLDRYGQEVGRRGIRHDDSVKLEELPDHLIKAALATEDRRFFEHWGIDPIGLVRALTVNAKGGGSMQGGSTLTQQLAKNLFLSNERSIERKINEAFLSLWLEWHLTKNEILKLYFDRAYMGGGAFGVAAAAEYYFGKSVKDVTLAEAAMMAGLFKAPTKFAPHVNLPAARARANDVLSNMVEAGFLTEGQIQTARRNPATPVDRRRESSPDYYLDWAFDQVKQMADRGRLGAERVLVVKTPLDLAVQKRGEQVLEDLLRQHGKQYDVEQGSIVVMDPDGGVRAMVGGRDYGQSQFNRATDALRQPGSSFKPFVYATAMTHLPRYRPNAVVVDRPVCIGNWCPANYGRSFSGSVPLTSALARSINTIPVIMSVELGRGNAKVGRARIIELTRRMGVKSNLTDSTSLPIGSAEVTVLDMATGYAVFANGGRAVEPYAAFEIRNTSGDLIYRRDRSEREPEQVLSPQVVADMNFMMTKVPEEGTGKRAALEGIRSAGKTGTTNAYRDAWYVGYTGNLVAAVWFGNDDHTTTNNMTGGSLPAMAWHEVMALAHQNTELRPIPGVPPMGAEVAQKGRPVVQTTASVQPSQPPAVPGSLSKRSFEVIGGIGDLLRSVDRPQVRADAGSRGFAGPARPAATASFGPVQPVGRLATP